MSRATRLLAVAITLCAVAALGCAPEDEASETDREIAAFEQKLSGGKSFSEACKELQVLCTTTGFGCKAHTLFCQVPTKQQICQQLAAACSAYPAACDVYKIHCGSQPSPSCGDNTCDPNAEDCQSCPQDCGKCLPGQCGDGQCDAAAGEDCKSCPIDCANATGGCVPPGQCGDGKCDPSTEDCKSCPQDCANSAGGCVPPGQCGDGKCDPNGAEDCQSCPKDCGTCSNTGPNSGLPCSQSQPCPKGDSCIMFSSTNTSGMCVASCQGPGAQCPTSTPGTVSACALTDSSGALYCAYLCEAQGATFSCPAGLVCVAQPGQNVKVCLPK